MYDFTTCITSVCFTTLTFKTSVSIYNVDVNYECTFYKLTFITSVRFYNGNVHYECTFYNLYIVCMLNKKVYYVYSVYIVIECTSFISGRVATLTIVRLLTITGILVHVNISQVNGFPTHVNIWGTLPSRACLTLGHNLPVVHIRFTNL